MKEGTVTETYGRITEDQENSSWYFASEASGSDFPPAEYTFCFWDLTWNLLLGAEEEGRSGYVTTRVGTKWWLMEETVCWLMMREEERRGFELFVL